MSPIDPHELKQAANDTVTIMADGIKGAFDVLNYLTEEIADQTVDIYKGRHENPIFSKIKNAPDAVIDKIQPLDRLYLNDKLQKPVSDTKDLPRTNFDNYRIEVDGETIYQESSNGRVNINKSEQFYASELDKKREFTVADAFSSQYDPPTDNPPPVVEEIEEEYLDEVSPFDDPPTDNPLSVVEEIREEYLDEAILFDQPLQDNSSPVVEEQEQFTDNPQNNQKSPPSKEQNINSAFVVASKDIKQVKSSRLKSLLQSTFSRLWNGIKKIDNTISRQIQVSQQKNSAKTLKKLFDANLMQTGETTFKSNTLDVQLKGLNTYQVTDKQGNIKLEFNQERFGGLKIIQSSLSGQDLKSIEKATNSVNSLGANTVLKQDLPERINLLGSIAPKSDHQIREDLDTNAVAKTAKSFLHYMGVDSWNREGGQYEIEQKGDNLKIHSKESGQEILKINNGKLKSRLQPKDINFFRKLDSTMKAEITKIREKNLNLSSQFKSTPKIFNQQELTR